MCDCIELVNQRLKEHGNELDTVFTFDGNRPRVSVPLIRQPRAKKLLVPADFCPFCGKRYQAKEEANRDAA